MLNLFANVTYSKSKTKNNELNKFVILKSEKVARHYLVPIYTSFVVSLSRAVPRSFKKPFFLKETRK